MATGRIEHIDLLEPGNPFADAIKGAEKFQKINNSLVSDIKKNKKEFENLGGAKTGANLKNVNNELKQQEVNLKALVTINKAELNARAKTTEAYKLQAKTVAELNIQNQKQTIINKNLARINAAQAGSYEKLNAEMLENIRRSKTMAVTTKKQKREQDKLNKTIQKQNTLLKRHDKAMGNSQRNVGNYTGALKGMGRQLLTVAGVGGGLFMFVNILKSTIKILVSFEKEFANVLTLLSEFEKAKFGGILKEGTIGLIADFGFAIEDINKALFDTISAGIPAGEAVNFLREAAILAKGGVTDLTTAVDGVSSIMNAWQLEIKDTNKVTSALFSAQKFGKTTVQELSASIGQSAAIAKLAGISFQELLSTYAELTKQGIKTTDATVAIKAIIQAVIKPSRIAADKFKELGIEVGLTAVKEQGLFTILQKITAEVERDNDSLTQLIPNVRALTGAGALGVEALEDYHRILAIVNTDFGEGSSLSEAYALQMDTLNEKVKSLSGSWKAFVLSLDDGDSFMGKFVKKSLDIITFNLDLLAGRRKLNWDLTVGALIKTEEEITEVTTEGQNKRLAELKTQNEFIINEIKREGERLKELYGEDFTNFDDILQQKEGANLKYLFKESAIVDKQIAKIKELSAAAEKSPLTPTTPTSPTTPTAPKANKFFQDAIDARVKKVKFEFDERETTMEEFFAIEEDLIEKELDLFLTAEEKKRQDILKTAELDKTVQAAKVELVNSGSQLAITLAGKETAAAKIFASAQIAFNTGIAATAALKLPPPADFLKFAAVTAAGLAQLAKVNKVNFWEGTDEVTGGTPGKDSVNALVAPKERIVPVKDNLPLLKMGVTNSELPGLASIGRMMQGQYPKLTAIAGAQLNEQRETNKNLRKWKTIDSNGVITDLSGQKTYLS